MLRLAGGAKWRGAQVIGGFDARSAKRNGFQRLALGFHDVRQFDEARLVQAQIDGDHRRQFDFQGFQAGIDFAGDLRFIAINGDGAGEGGLRAAPQRGQHLAGLAGVVVNGLLAHQHQAGLFFFNQFQERARGGKRLDGGIGDHMNGAVGAHRQAVADMRLAVGRAHGDHDHFGSQAFIAQAQRFFQGDVVERVGGQFHAIGNHARTIGFHLNAHVVIDHALVTNQNLHCTASQGI